MLSKIAPFPSRLGLSLVALVFVALAPPLAAQSFNHEIIFESGFEDGSTGGWGGRGHPGAEESVAVSGDIARSGKRSLSISKRTKTWHGPIFKISDRAKSGDAYRISAWLYYNEGPLNTAVQFSVERSFTDDKKGHSYQNVKAARMERGTWTEFSFDYIVGPDKDQKEIWFYFESPWKSDSTPLVPADTLSFWMDDVRILKLDPESLPKMRHDTPNLSDVLAKRGIDIGAAIGPEDLDSSTQQGQLLIKHFSTMVAGNAHKMDAVAVRESVYNWKTADSIVDFARMTGKRVRWHTLVWHNQSPDWIFKNANGTKVSKSVLNMRLKEYIQTVVGRYRGKVSSYDVVNEVLSDRAGLRTGAEGSQWYDILGPEFIDNAFRWARQADPDVQLVINDYNLASSQRKRQEMYKLVKGMKERGVPVDAVGMQMHISVGHPSVKDVEDTIALFASLGVKVVITELDMSIYASDGEKQKVASDAILLAQARKYRDLFTVFERAAAKGWLDTVLVWGLSDDRSWLNDFPVKGRANAPLFFDTRLQPKPAFWALVDPKQVPGL